MAQLTIETLLAQTDRYRVAVVAGPTSSRDVQRVDVVALDALASARAGTLAIVPVTETPAPYRLDVALRQASARRLAGLLFTAELTLPVTAVALADRGDVPVLTAPGAKAADLALAIDRLLSGGASAALTRATQAIAAASETAAYPNPTADAIVAAAARGLGAQLELVEDPTTSWTASDAVCVGEVPIGRLVAADPDAATAVAVPVIASIVSRALQRELSDRFASTQSRSDLIVELILAESSRVEGFVGQAARLGFPLQLSHVAAWLSPSPIGDPDAIAPRSIQAALELFTLQLVDGREEMWHVAFVQDDLLLVSTEEHGAGDHQRRLREVAARVQEQARMLAGDGWAYTVGLGTPQIAATGLRQSAAEARIAAESAIAAGRPGGIELTDVTGLRRVLLDLYASPISRSLLGDILEPLDALGPERSATAVRTLQSYLAHRNSLVHAGKELVLHPNAVGYRLKRIREQLDLDLDDPDTRFAVELACRVRMLSATRR